MRIASQNSSEFSIQQNSAPKKVTSDVTTTNVKPETIKGTTKKIDIASSSITFTENDKESIKEKLSAAVETMNEVIDTTPHKASKFVLHDGLDKYYVQLVDAETEEVIKEIPPQKLLDAFYEMQKMMGMIVDEKI